MSSCVVYARVTSAQTRPGRRPPRGGRQALSARPAATKDTQDFRFSGTWLCNPRPPYGRRTKDVPNIQ